jgi:hypothetical protein
MLPFPLPLPPRPLAPLSMELWPPLMTVGHHFLLLAPLSLPLVPSLYKLEPDLSLQAIPSSSHCPSLLMDEPPSAVHRSRRHRAWNSLAQHPDTRSHAARPSSSPYSRRARRRHYPRSTPTTVPTPFVDRPPSVEPQRNSRPTVRTHRWNYVVRRRRDHAAHQLDHRALEPVRRHPFTQVCRQPANLLSKSCFKLIYGSYKLLL